MTNEKKNHKQIRFTVCNRKMRNSAGSKRKTGKND